MNHSSSGLRAGTARALITPEVGVELCGYLARVQPSTGCHDDLYAHILCVEGGGGKAVWVNCDLVGFTNELAGRVRGAVAERLGVGVEAVLLSATHTHSGPATVSLRKCGDVSPAYIDFLVGAVVAGSEAAAANMEDVGMSFSETIVGGLSFDRRKPSGNSHVDNTLPVLAFRRGDGSFKAVVANFAMHNVGLSSANRGISADIAGFAARRAGAGIPGNPVVLLSNGGCGNINPVAMADDYSVVERLGTALGDAIVRGASRLQLCGDVSVSSACAELELPLEPPPLEELVAPANVPEGGGYVDVRCREAMELWRSEARRALERTSETATACLHVLKLGPVVFAGVNAEVFSVMAERLRRATGWERLYVVGYADGCVGYLAPREIYAEGGYEVDDAHKFYGHFRLKPGCFELIREKLSNLVATSLAQTSLPSGMAD